LFNRAALSGFCAMLIGIGLGRFAYTPLIPALIQDGWLSPAAAAYLGAANLAGYLAGALFGRGFASLIGDVPRTLRVAMVACAVSLAACAIPAGLLWLTPWRFVAGFSGAALMVLAGPAILGATPPERRGRVGGLIYAGIGTGVAVSGTAMPFLVGFGLSTAWLCLAAAAAILTAVAWTGWPADATPPANSSVKIPRLGWAVVPLLAAYACDGIGFVPHTLFWVDFLARELGLGLPAGGFNWGLFGLGAVFGPLVAGWLADRLGFKLAWSGALALKAAAVILPVIWVSGPTLALSSIVVGALTPGMVVLAAGRIVELVDPASRSRVWSLMTAAFALAQAGAAYGMTAVASVTHSYIPLFIAGALALLLGSILSGLSPTRSPANCAPRI
jgi:predicted MFS family arabinose efflux permease